MDRTQHQLEANRCCALRVRQMEIRDETTGSRELFNVGEPATCHHQVLATHSLSRLLSCPATPAQRFNNTTSREILLPIHPAFPASTVKQVSHKSFVQFHPCTHKYAPSTFTHTYFRSTQPVNMLGKSILTIFGVTITLSNAQASV